MAYGVYQIGIECEILVFVFAPGTLKVRRQM
jgi:hypothetical protein